MGKNIYRVGDVVKLNRSFLNEPSGTLGYVYDEYNLDDDGVMIVTENGVNLGGFSASAWADEPLTSEQADFLTFVRHSNYYYKFENVIKLDRDFKMIHQKVF